MASAHITAHTPRGGTASRVRVKGPSLNAAAGRPVDPGYSLLQPWEPLSSLAPIHEHGFELTLGLTAVSTADHIHDVVIVGCGPVGAIAAGLLSAYGADVVCLEREDSVYPAPRAVAVDDETIRMLGLVSPDLGAWFAEHVLRCPVDIRNGPPPVPMTNRCLPGSSGGSWSIVGPVPPYERDTTGYPDTSFFHQPQLEDKLRETAFLTPGHKARLFNRVEVASITVPPVNQPDRPIVILAKDTKEKRSKEFRCRIVIGADGGASFVRRTLGLKFEGSSYPDEPWLVVDCETSDPEVCARWQSFSFICDPLRPFVHVPLPGSRCGRRFEFLLNKGENPEEMKQGGSVMRLLESIGVPPSSVRVIRAVVYTFHARQASEWRVGRVLLMGDAAHCSPPFRGQGMCSGVRDAINACWKIAAALSLPVHSPVADFLLASYQQERQAHFSAVLATALSMGQLIMLRSRALAFGRDILLGTINIIPALRPLLKEPFGLPSSLNNGVFDFHDMAGKRRHEDKSALPGWMNRDWATGRTVPNACVQWANDGTFNANLRHGRLDEAIWAVIRASLPLHGAGAPWVLLLSPCLARGTGSQVLPFIPDAVFPNLGQPKTAKLLIVVQILPASGAFMHMQSHAWARRRGGLDIDSQEEHEGVHPHWFYRSHASIADATTQLQCWFESIRAEAVLLRPDRAVYGAYTRDEIGGALQRVREIIRPHEQGTGEGQKTHVPLISKRPSYSPERCWQALCFLWTFVASVAPILILVGIAVHAPQATSKVFSAANLWTYGANLHEAMAWERVSVDLSTALLYLGDLSLLNAAPPTATSTPVPTPTPIPTLIPTSLSLCHDQTGLAYACCVALSVIW